MVARVVLILRAVLAFGCATAAPAGNGSFSVLSYNVGFLSSSNPKVNIPILAPRLAPYGIVNVQEDFNYHEPLYAGDTHPYRTITSGGVPFGSGLNTMSKYPIIDLQRLLRARLDEGVYIDVYNLHTDAGDSFLDVAARKSNIAQLVSYITLNSVGNPVLIYGDTNALYTNSTDGLRQFASAGFTDVWVQAKDRNECNVLDSAFLDSAGGLLSDHYPITADFTYALSAFRRLTDLAGGTGGVWFSDLPLIPSSPPSLTSITLSGADRLDYVSLTLSSGVVFRHGGTGGTPSTLTLSPGELVIKLRIDTSSYRGETRVFYVSAETSSGRSLSAGKKTGTSATWTAPNGMGLKGVYGRAKDGVNMLGGIWA
ncbi:hypothetical protein FRC10_003034 [Ceratobasidium sp. 414]|nr:hypothetical protein FRC10_003034 [Ceratobasidium sp. 414]